MKRPLAPHRNFRGPGNMEGIPKVRKRTPIPVRDEPLPGTVEMVFPEDRPLDVPFGQRRQSSDRRISRFGDLLGGFAILSALVGLAVLAVGLWADARMGAWFWVCTVITHLLAVFSQIHPGTTLRGAWAVLILYVGAVVCFLAA